MEEPFPPPNDDEVYEFLTGAITHMFDRTDINKGPGQRGRHYSWYWGYYGRAALDYFLATGQERFLTLVRQSCDRLLNERDDVVGCVDGSRGVLAPGWGTPFDGLNATEVTTAGLITLPMVQYAYVAGDETIARAAFETLSFHLPEQNIDSDGAVHFVHQTTKRVEALNHAHVYGAALAHATRLNGAPPEYAQAALGIRRYFERFAQADGSALSWPYEPTPEHSMGQLPAEPIWKACISLELPVALHEVGISDESIFLTKVAQIIKANPLVRVGRIPHSIASTSRELGPEYDGKSMAGGLACWLLLDDAELEADVLSLMKENPEKFPGAWYGGSRWMIMGYAKRRLRKARAT